MSLPEDPVTHVRDALRSGRLRAEDLTARRLGDELGKTTSVLYHHYGSLDGFLHAVAQSGLSVLAERLDAVLAAGGDFADVAEAFVRFGMEAPALYALQFERRFDWAQLRRTGCLPPDLPGRRLWQLTVEHLRLAGAKQPALDARMLFAGLHGLVSLALSGRANIGTLEVPDEVAAVEAARALARRLCPLRHRQSHSKTKTKSNRTSQRSTHDDDRRSAAPAQRKHAAQPPRQVGDERAPGRTRRRPR
jgi:AcrR family transcriptional regulator